MKKYLFLFLCLGMTGTFLASCEKESEDDMELQDDVTDDQTINGVVVTEYPASIDTYVSENYPGLTIQQVELMDDGTYEVKLSDGIELVFDENGNFLNVDDEGDDDSDDGDDVEDDDDGDDDNDSDGDDDGDTIVTDYPPAIDEYVAANHSGTTIVEVELESDGTYEVELDDGTELHFDADGNFIG